MIATSDTGSASSTTVNVSVPPASVTDTDVVDNVNPAGTTVPRLPDESSLTTNTSLPELPPEVNSVVPEPGSKSTVPEKYPVV